VCLAVHGSQAGVVGRTDRAGPVRIGEPLARDAAGCEARVAVVQLVEDEIAVGVDDIRASGRCRGRIARRRERRCCLLVAALIAAGEREASECQAAQGSRREASPRATSNHNLSNGLVE
jgi:hypothetical protein